MKINKNSFLLSVVVFLFQPMAVFSMTDDMCSEDKKCVLCREEIKCQTCYYKCANKYGKIESDINFVYRLNDKEVRALKCYKKCWDEVVDINTKKVKL